MTNDRIDVRLLVERVSPQDWMCEPQILTDRSIAEHQKRIVANYFRWASVATRHCAICGEPDGSSYAKPCCTDDQMIGD